MPKLNSKRVLAFDLRTHLLAYELTIAHDTIINQYTQKLWLAENLIALPLAYV